MSDDERDLSFSSSWLTIDLDALAANWRELDSRSGSAETAAVVKANGYGMGATEVARRLFQEGCRTFFVATVSEGVTLRQGLHETKMDASRIFVLNGRASDTDDAFVANDLTPVLNSFEDCEFWADVCQRIGKKLPAAIHVDTGMSRLGFDNADLAKFEAAQGASDHFETVLVMTHPACADEPDNPMTARQFERFEAARKRLPAAPASFANSAATLAHPGTHLDLVRPGIALYGGRAVNGRSNPMRPVALLDARMLQVREVPAGTSVGYGATFVTQRPSRLATIAVGYADGFARAIQPNAAETAMDGTPLMVYYAGHPAPVVGRISMDLIIVDATDWPDHIGEARGMVELIGHRTTVDDLADRAGTIGYEILTGLGARSHRQYKDASADGATAPTGASGHG